MWEILTKLVDEDPCLKVEHVAATNETIVYGLGELHLRVLLDRLREVYKFEVNTRPPRIAYRETVTATAEGHHRHKKQTGGAGQFGEVFLRIEPLPRGAGFEFVDQVKGGTIPGQFIPAVEKGVREVLASGAIAGYPVVDVRSSSTTASTTAWTARRSPSSPPGARPSWRRSARRGRSCWSRSCTSRSPRRTAAMGDITGDLSSRRGLVNGTANGAAGHDDRARPGAAVGTLRLPVAAECA